MPPAPALLAVSDYDVDEASDSDEAPPNAAHSFGPIRPDRLTVWPTADGTFGIDVRWQGRECILRAVVVRRMLTEAGYAATAGNSIDGRTWQVSVSPVPAGKVAEVIETFI
jgi:hypothetical protein